MSNLLIEEYPLVVLPKLAAAIGLNEAIVLQQIHYWVKLFKTAQDQHHFQDGKWWVWNTGTEWAENFPFWSESTVRRTLDNLRNPYAPEKDKDKKIKRNPLIIVGRYNRKGYDQTLWYRVDYAEVERIEAILSKCLNGHVQDDEKHVGKMDKPIPETITETITDLSGSIEPALPEVIQASSQPVDIHLTDLSYPVESCPRCDGDIILRNLSKSAAICPHCKSGLILYGPDGEVICKPPQNMRERKRKRVLGDILPECPEVLQDVMYYAKDEKRLKMWSESAIRYKALLDSLMWAMGKYANGKMKENAIAQNALTAASNRWAKTEQLEPKRTQQHMPTRIKDPLTGEWRDV